MKRARLLAFVLTAAMATSVFLGGTVARYQTTANIDDTATVAKWGVKLTMAGNLYGENYVEGVLSGSIPTVSDTAISVQADSSSDIIKDNVAPGTKGDTLKISLTGKTEVDVEIKATIKAQDVYLAEGTYAVMVEIGTLTQLEFENMNKTMKMAYKNDSGSYTAVTGWSAACVGKTFYMIQNKVSVGAGGYYPVEHTVEGYSSEPYTKVTEWATFFGSKISGSSLGVGFDDKDTSVAGVSYLDTEVKQVIDSNVNLNTLGLETNVNMSWEWAIDGDDNADTVLGALADDNQIVVLLTGVDTYTAIAKDANGIVKNGGNEVGSVKTYFDITITVSQED